MLRTAAWITYAAFMLVGKYQNIIITLDNPTAFNGLMLALHVPDTVAVWYAVPGWRSRFQRFWKLWFWISIAMFLMHVERTVAANIEHHLDWWFIVGGMMLLTLVMVPTWIAILRLSSDH